MYFTNLQIFIAYFGNNESKSACDHSMKLYHCILHRKDYPSLLQIQYWWQIPSGPFCQSMSHNIMIYIHPPILHHNPPPPNTTTTTTKKILDKTQMNKVSTRRGGGEEEEHATSWNINWAELMNGAKQIWKQIKPWNPSVAYLHSDTWICVTCVSTAL